jgi:D-alanyl-D-alanine carboxypeptidase
MKTYILIAIIGLALSAMFSSCEKTDDALPVNNSAINENPGHPNASNYQQILDDLLATGVPGVSVTVRSPEGIWSKAGGKADLKNNIDLNPGHALRAGSMTKTFTATTILILQDERVLSIDDKINKYIPSGITDKIDNANEVTIRQLLNMTSGIRDYHGLKSILGILNLSAVKKSAEENLETIYNKPANFRPGVRNLYTNANYLLAGLVIKYATGKPADEVVQEKIIDRFGLSNTYVSTATPENLSRSYYDIYDDGYMKDVTEIDNNAVGGEDMLDGGIISSSYDLALFLDLLMHGDILQENSLNQMKEFLEVTEDLGDMDFLTQYGLGLMYLETDNGVAIGHYGNVYGFTGLFYYFPDDDIILSVLINGYSAEISDMIYGEEIFNHLFN